MADTISDVYLKIQGVGLIGECSDLKHPGKDGWIGISSFGFSFSFDDKSPGQAGASASAHAAPTAGKGAPAAGKGATDKKDDSKQVHFSKKPDAASIKLAQLCYDGTPVDSVTFEACRYGGSESGSADGTSQGIKIPFLSLTFKNVFFKKLALQISTEGMPTENLEFAYDMVSMNTIWTANTTGDRVSGGQNQAGWDFIKNIAYAGDTPAA